MREGKAVSEWYISGESTLGNWSLTLQETTRKLYKTVCLRFLPVEVKGAAALYTTSEQAEGEKLGKRYSVKMETKKIIVAILISDKIDYKAKAVTRDKATIY